LVAMVGAGIGLACFGYSFVSDGRVQAHKMADAMRQALERAQLTTTGELKLADGSTVALAPGGQVAIAPGGVVRGDPSYTAKNSKNDDVLPTPVLPPAQTTPSLPSKVITQYTIFKTVQFGKGQVVTGWSFADSNQAYPANQYCYYSEKANDTIAVRTDLGTNKTMLSNLKPRPDIDLIAAYNSCVWFSGSL